MFRELIFELGEVDYGFAVKCGAEGGWCALNGAGFGRES